MADFGSRQSGFFGGTSSGGGGGTSTGVNGLNGTTNIGLGGTLTGNTTIDGASKTFDLSFTNLDTFEIIDANSITLKSNSGASFSNLSATYNLIQTTFNDGVLSAQEGFYLDFNVRQYVFGGTDATINCDSVNQKIIFATKGLQLDAITLNNGATTPSVNSIPITINSIQYYILLAT